MGSRSASSRYPSTSSERNRVENAGSMAGRVAARLHERVQQGVAFEKGERAHRQFPVERLGHGAKRLVVDVRMWPRERRGAPGDELPEQQRRLLRRRVGVSRRSSTNSDSRVNSRVRSSERSKYVQLRSRMVWKPSMSRSTFRKVWKYSLRVSTRGVLTPK